MPRFIFSMIVIALFLALGGDVLGQETTPSDLESRIEALEKSHSRRLEALERDHQLRVGKLEATIDDLGTQLKDAVESVQDPIATEIEGIANELQSSRIGLRGRGHAIYDNRDNPSISVIGDFVLATGNAEDSFASSNQFRVRSVELAIAGRVDSLMTYNIVLHVDEEEIELEEAFGQVSDWLPFGFELKFGRYNIDFGKLSRIHEHGLPFLDKPQVLQAFVGGSLRGTGIELHHLTEVSDDVRLRWSLGIVNGLGGDQHPVFGAFAEEEHGHEDEEEISPFGERKLHNFAFNARITTMIQWDARTTIQLGISGAWAPQDRQFFADALASTPDSEAFLSRDLQRAVLGFDFRIESLDPVTQEGFIVAAELLYSRQDVFLAEDELETASLGSWGFYAHAAYQFDANWSLGVLGGWLEDPEVADRESWDVGPIVTWQVNEFNRLRLEGRYFDSNQEQGVLGIALQWTVIIGSHAQGSSCPCGTGVTGNFF